MSAPLVFIDTETTGLNYTHDDVWEVAAIRREDSGLEFQVHFFVEHDEDRCRALPEPFATDHAARFGDSRVAPTLSVGDAADKIRGLFAGRAHMVAANPAFDSRMLSRLVGGADPWNYHLIDVEAMALGWTAGRSYLTGIQWKLPYKSDNLSRWCGVEPPFRDRHTALGDVLWVAEWYDSMVSGAREEDTRG